MSSFRSLIASALTHVHVGVGRSPGVVDLPVVKDPFGIFYIPGSSIKGTMKTSVGHKCCNKAVGETIDCEKCEVVCCLFGGEEGGETSRIVVSDLYPLLIPVPSMDKGMIFVTGNILVKKAEAMLSVAPSQVSIFDKGGEEEEIYIGVERVKVTKRQLSTKFLDLIKKLNPLYELATYVYELKSNEELALVIRRSLVQLTRIRLDRKKKTVVSGALWTEEYIPHGTLFIGVIGDRGWDNKYCKNVQNALDIFKKIMNGGTFTLIVGGKETVGKGLMSFEVI